MRERKVDPAVLVDIPDIPDAEQLEQAAAANPDHTSVEVSKTGNA